MGADGRATIGERLAALETAAELLCQAEDQSVNRVGQDISAWLQGEEHQTLDHALGLAPGQSMRSWRTELAVAKRDALLREAAQRFFLGWSASAAAAEMAEGLARFQASAWRRERGASECPARHLGRISECWWRVLRLRDRPLSASRMRRILATSTGVSWPT